MSDKAGISCIDRTAVVGPFQCNCRLLACPRTGEAALVDPGDELPKILALLKDAQASSSVPIRLKYLLHTHGHLDHVGATRGVRESLGAAAPVIALHRGDEPLYRQLRMQGQLFGIQYDDPLPVEKFLEDGEELRLGDLRLSVLHTPGHSPGSVCLRLHEDSAAGARETVYTGDTLFQGSVGRTDLWGGDADTLLSSIKDRLLRLDGDTRVYAGHGPDSRIGVERVSNPFLA